MNYKNKLQQLISLLPSKTSNRLPTTPCRQYNMVTDNATPVYALPHIIPKARELTLSNEIDRLIDAGMIDKFQYSSGNNDMFLNINDMGKYNENAIPRELTIGQKVFRKNFKLSSAADKYSPKLDKKFFPATVKKKIGDFTYELTDPNGKSVGNFHINHIRT